VRADNTILLSGKDVGYQSSWDPEWQVATRQVGKSWFAEFAIPLAQIPGLQAGIGEVFRFDLLRNLRRQRNSIMHWSPTGGALNGRPVDFGFAALTGPDPRQFRWRDIKPQHLNKLIVTDKYQDARALSGYPITLNLVNPIGSQVADGPRELLATLKTPGGLVVRQGRVDTSSWPRALTIAAPSEGDGTYRLELSSPADRKLLFSTALQWQPAVTVSAEDAAAVPVQGEKRIGIYPRGINRNSLFLYEGARATVTGGGRAIYLLLPPFFGDPGPNLGSALPATFRYRIDNGAWKSLAAVDVSNQVALAENLPNRSHRVELEVTGGYLPIHGFAFAAMPLAGIRGTITTGEYTELLMDARLDTFAGGKIVRTDYVRNPGNGKFALLGLEPGTYRFRFTASGWMPYETKPLAIARGQKIELGPIALQQEPAVRDYARYYAPYYFYGMGKAVSAAPGETFEVNIAKGVKAQIVSRYKTIDLKALTSQPGDRNTPPRTKFEVPSGTPHDMYALRVGVGEEWAFDLPQAVCIREPLPDDFHVAGVSHMNTWGQETSEYLAKVAETVQLAGARTLLIANEVNPAYIAGALKDLRIPYLATAGNHTMPRWDDFFGPRTYAVDDGPMRIVTYNDTPFHSWADVARLATERPEATNRVLLAYEAYAPLDVILEGKLGLLFDGHSVEEHPLHAQFAPGTVHIRAPDYQAIRWIAMTRQGLDSAYKGPKDIPSFRVPRVGPAPLRVAFSAPNDGTAAESTARIVNELSVPFPRARLRFVMKVSPGGYSVQGGKILQSFVADDGKVCVVDVEAAVPAQSKITVQVRPAE
jgi:hypothetical protein